MTDIDGRNDQPPAARAAAAAIALLEPLDTVAALAHLLTPAGHCVGLQVQVAGRRVSWRGATIDLPADVHEAAAAFTRFAAGSAAGGDVWLDLAAAPYTWCKPLLSGARIRLAGVSELFAGPQVWLTGAPPLTGLDAPAALDVLARLAAADSLAEAAAALPGWQVRTAPGLLVVTGRR